MKKGRDNVESERESKVREEDGGRARGAEATEAKKKAHNKKVMYSPLIQIVRVTPYAEVYGRHPREFVFDGRGNHITKTIMIEPAPHKRELRVRARAGSDIDPSCSLLDVGYISKEEECKGRTDISDCIDMSRLTDVLPPSSSGSSHIVGCMGRANL